MTQRRHKPTPRRANRLADAANHSPKLFQRLRHALADTKLNSFDHSLWPDGLSDEARIHLENYKRMKLDGR